MSTYRTEQQKKRKQAEKKKATKTVSKKHKSSKKATLLTKTRVAKSKNVRATTPATSTRQRASVVSQPVATTTKKSAQSKSVKTQEVASKSSPSSSVAPTSSLTTSASAPATSTVASSGLTPSSISASIQSTPSPTIAHLAESVGRASVNASAPSSLYPAYLSELSPEGATRQLLQHAQMKPVALGQLKAHVRSIRASGIRQTAIWQLIGGGTLLALGILPQVVVFPFGPLYISLYQVLLNALTIALGNNGILPAVLIALVQVMLIGGGATLTTLGVLNQAKFDSWKLSEEIANRV